MTWHTLVLFPSTEVGIAIRSRRLSEGESIVWDAEQIQLSVPPHPMSNDAERLEP